jgi:signal transduction histidine kinase
MREITRRQLQHLAAAMAHEVRNPLNSMAIHVELLDGRLRKETLADRPAALKSVATLANEIERIDKVLDEFLQFAGPEESTRKPVEPSLVLGEAVGRARPLAESRGVVIETKIAHDSGKWPLDAEELGAALDEVLANAVESCARGQTVMVEAQSDEDQAQVIVRDPGVGISAEDLPKVFHLGFSRRGRAGIGLAVAKQIIKSHGGSIVVSSAGVGAGAQFTLRLPLEGDA